MAGLIIRTGQFGFGEIAVRLRNGILPVVGESVIRFTVKVGINQRAPLGTGTDHLIPVLVGAAVDAALHFQGFLATADGQPEAGNQYQGSVDDLCIPLLSHDFSRALMTGVWTGRTIANEQGRAQV